MKIVEGKGTALEKLSPGKGAMVLDRGVSTMVAVANGKAAFLVLTNGVRGHEKEIWRDSVAYEWKRWLANPENCNQDGAVR